MGTLILVILACLSVISRSKCEEIARPNSRKVIEMNGSPQSVIWVVQLSDLHFSVHHPDRALDFSSIVGPTLFDQPFSCSHHCVGGSFDFFSQYSISGQLGRRGNVNSVTVQASASLQHTSGFFLQHMVVLCPAIKEAASYSGKSLKAIFLKQSVSAYLCGHLHTVLGKNLKRHHQLEAMKTIIVHTFPLVSQLMCDTASSRDYKCQAMNHLAYQTIRALVFSISPVVSVKARVYDSRSGNHDLVLETHMMKPEDSLSWGELYAAPWNYQAFEDLYPDRHWLQIEATDIMCRESLTELRPFSVNALVLSLHGHGRNF
ncbi:hypothetical protein RJ641_036544 [Dillenia turbinata]|uniref:TMEM62 Ig-like domain-containing protein n=1 Tax=Dillenia turbinata TaxID=194707 RepID=A0AAN8VGH8_9MAGN